MPTPEEIARGKAELKEMRLEHELDKERAEVARLKEMIVAKDDTPHPELGKYIRIRALKGGCLRFYTSTGAQYESRSEASEKVEAIMAGLEEFYLTETKKRVV